MTIRSLLLAIALALAPGCVTTSGSGAHADRAGSGDDPAAQATGDAGSDPALARILRRAQEGDPEGAEQALQEEVRRRPERDLHWTQLGILQERLGKTGRAKESYLKALEKNPGQLTANLNLVRLHARENTLPTAEAELLARLEQHPQAPGARLGLSQLRLIQGRTGEAAEEAKKVLRQQERNTHAMRLLAAAYAAEKKFELAQMVLENAIAIDPDDGALHNALGRVQLELDQQPQALASFAKASQLQPDLAEARNNHGALLVEAQDFAGAEVEVRAALEMAPSFVAAHLNLGNALRGQGKVEEARAAYEQALKLEPELAEAWFNLGILYLDSAVPSVDDLDRYRQALSWFETYAQQGGADEALAEYRKDAQRAIDREERRIEREKRTALRKAEEERKQQEAAREAARVAAETARKEAEAAGMAGTAGDGAPGPAAEAAAPAGPQENGARPATPTPRKGPRAGQEGSARLPAAGKTAP
ncbi:MAG TPA: tetratricopeptide repeat protein [Myxococcaceae bacterium]|nr:tetratricopeptide repeat protein [Myxococcaceae bacterium]